jgi:glycosyltransferase involved in cell wall biosynthesis
MNGPGRRLAAVVPALNEVRSIGAIVGALAAVAESVYVVDDGSTDGTGAAAERAGATVLRNDRPTGYDAAIAAGINAAFARGAEAVVTCDADGQHRIDDVVRVASLVLDGGNDLAAGVRDRYNRRIEAVLGRAGSALFGTRDPFCGLKAYGASLYRRTGPFPPALNVGTLPLAWVRRDHLRAAFVPIAVERRADASRFAGRWTAEVRLIRAFAATAAASVARPRASRADRSHSPR